MHFGADAHLGAADLQSDGAVTSGAKLSLLEYQLAIVRVSRRQQECAVLASNLSDLQHFTTSFVGLGSNARGLFFFSWQVGCHALAPRAL
jgi:hypothetical protein